MHEPTTPSPTATAKKLINQLTTGPRRAKKGGIPFYIFLGHFILKNSDDTHGITAPFFARVHSELQRITGAPAAAR